MSDDLVKLLLDWPSVYARQAADRIEELEAKLAYASVALQQALCSLSFAAHELAAQAHIPEEDSEMLRDRISLVVTAIAKIKGEQP